MTEVIETILAREQEAEQLIAQAKIKVQKIESDTNAELLEIEKNFLQEQKEADTSQQTDTAALAKRIKANQAEETELECQRLEHSAEKNWITVKENLLKEIV